MRDAEEQVARLVELHADDAATRGRDPRLLATALVVLATAASPASALAAGATDSVQRIHRILGPSEPLGRARRQLRRATAAALALTPVLLALTPAVIPLALGKLPGRLASQAILLSASGRDTVRRLRPGRLAGPVNAGDRRGHLIVSPHREQLLSPLVFA